MPQLSIPGKKDFGLIIIFALALIFCISFGFVNILKFRIFSSTTFGWHLFYSYLKIAQGRSIFGIYILPEFPVIFYLFSPINYLIAFAYKIMPYPEMLLIFQAIILASGAFPVYLLARLRLHNAFIAVAFSVSYLLNPVISTGATLGFVSPALGLPFLLWSLYYLERNDFKKFMLFIILANLSKIDTVVMALILGIILIFSKTKEKYGKSIFKISVIWLMVSFGLCLFFLKSKGRPFPVEMLRFDQYGGNLASISHYALSNSLSIMGNFFNRHNMAFYAFFSLPNILAFISPLYLLPIIPELGFLLLRNQLSSGNFLIVSFIIAAAIYGTEKITGLISKALVDYKGGKSKNSLIYSAFAIIILAFSLFRHYYAQPRFDSGDKLGIMPYTKEFSLKSYKLTSHEKIGYQFLKKITEDSSCLAPQPLAAHLGRVKFLARLDKYSLAENYAWDYIFLDLSKKDFYTISKKDYFLRLKRFLSEDNYGVLGFEDGWLLLKKGYSRNHNNELLDYIKGALSDEKDII